MLINIVTLLQGDAIQKNFYSSMRNSDRYSGLVISLSNVQHGRNTTRKREHSEDDTVIQQSHAEEVWRVNEPKTIDNDLKGGKQILGNIYKICIITLSSASFGNQQPSDTQESLEKAKSSRTGPVYLFCVLLCADFFVKYSTLVRSKQVFAESK